MSGLIGNGDLSRVAGTTVIDAHRKSIKDRISAEIERTEARLSDLKEALKVFDEDYSGSVGKALERLDALGHLG